MVSSNKKKMGMSGAAARTGILIKKRNKKE